MSNTMYDTEVDTERDEDVQTDEYPSDDGETSEDEIRDEIQRSKYSLKVLIQPSVFYETGTRYIFNFQKGKYVPSGYRLRRTINIVRLSGYKLKRTHRFAALEYAQLRDR